MQSFIHPPILFVMKDKNQQKELKKKGTGAGENIEKVEAPLQNKTDTAPDEFISPNADTDQPLDGHIMNDAVLFGESHADLDIDKLADKNKANKSIKRDKGNL
jgi:hypothetical protein